MLSIASSPICWAQTSIRQVTLKKGQAAPFAGRLLTVAALAKIITDYDRKLKTSQLLLEKAQRDLKAEQKANAAVCQAQVAVQVAKVQACTSDRSRQKVIYERAIKKCDAAVPWYRSPMLSFVIGNVVAGGICATSAVLGRK